MTSTVSPMAKPTHHSTLIDKLHRRVPEAVWVTDTRQRSEFDFNPHASRCQRPKIACQGSIPCLELCYNQVDYSEDASP